MTGKATDTKRRKPFTGWHMLAVLVGFFGVVIAVNLVNAYYASSTFGGMVVENSYVASQEFNGWLAKAREEKALGWTFDLKRGAGNYLDASLSSMQGALDGGVITVLAQHPLGRKPERKLTFRDLGNGHYQSVEVLPEGRWMLHVLAKADGREIHRIVDLQ